VITQCNHQGSPGPIICTEPSPDVARALSAAAAATAQGGNAGTTGSFGAGGASAEAVLALTGRSTALLGLRDGLYRACEAYANGAIGADAYALVLSRYGQLMTTLPTSERDHKSVGRKRCHRWRAEPTPCDTTVAWDPDRVEHG
jgi:hypothetical protein